MNLVPVFATHADRVESRGTYPGELMPLLVRECDTVRQFVGPEAIRRRSYLPDFNQRTFWISAIFLAALFLSVALVYGHDAIILRVSSVYAENGPLEDMQAAVLALSCLIFLVAACKTSWKEKLVPVFFSWLSYTFLLREVDVAKLDVPVVIKLVASGRGRDAILLAMLASIAVVGIRDFRHYRAKFMHYARSIRGALILACGACLLVADFFEKEHGIPFHDFFEELIEFGGYAVMLLAAVETLRTSFSES